MKNQQSQTTNHHPRPGLQFNNLFPNVYIKSWSFYVKKRGKHAQTNQNQKQLSPIAIVNTLQQFFSIYSAMKMPTDFQIDSKIMLFESGCRPIWQDWVHSGCLILQFRDSRQDQSNALNQIWQYLTFNLVGNQLDIDIIGLCLSKHQKQTLIQIWLRQSSRKFHIQKKIEELIQTDLEYIYCKLTLGIKMGYKQHKLSIQKNSTMKGTQIISIIQPPKFQPL